MKEPNELTKTLLEKAFEDTAKMFAEDPRSVGAIGDCYEDIYYGVASSIESLIDPNSRRAFTMDEIKEYVREENGEEATEEVIENAIANLLGSEILIEIYLIDNQKPDAKFYCEGDWTSVGYARMKTLFERTEQLGKENWKWKK